MVFGELSVPGRPTDTVNSRARAYCGWGLFGHFSLYCIFPSSFSLFLAERPM